LAFIGTAINVLFNIQQNTDQATIRSDQDQGATIYYCLLYHADHWLPQITQYYSNLDSGHSVVIMCLDHFLCGQQLISLSVRTVMPWPFSIALTEPKHFIQSSSLLYNSYPTLAASGHEAGWCDLKLTSIYSWYKHCGGRLLIQSYSLPQQLV